MCHFSEGYALALVTIIDFNMRNIWKTVPDF